MMDMVTQLIMALFATLGFAVIFRVPAKDLVACVLVGVLGWFTYLVAESYMGSPSIGCFLGACMVGLCSAIAARLFREAMTIFIIPGILCLVPGARIFYTMEALLTGEIDKMAQVGAETLTMAGAIAMGLLVMGAINNIIAALVTKTITIKDKL